MFEELSKLKIGDVVSYDVGIAHQDYAENMDILQKIRDCVSGQDAVRDAGTTYVAKPNGLSDQEYNAYIQRGLFFNAVGATKQGYNSMIFYHNPSIEIYAEDDDSNSIKNKKEISKNKKEWAEKILKRVSPEGKTLTLFLKDVVDELLTCGKVGILEDFPVELDMEGRVKKYNQLEYEKKNLHSVSSIYPAESIVNWQTSIIDHEVIPVMFSLRENVKEQDDENPLRNMYVPAYRVLFLTDENGKYVYKQVVFKKVEDSKKYRLAENETQNTSSYIVIETSTPMKNKKTMNRIPFWVLTNIGNEYTKQTKSILKDIADINIHHWNLSVDHSSMCHWLGVKTAVFHTSIDGFIPTLGQAIVLEANDQPAYMLEASSDSMLSKAMEEDEKLMAVLGASKISQEGRYIASGVTSEINIASEEATLADISATVSDVITDIMNFKLDWTGISDVKVRIQLSKDYFNDKLDGQLLTALSAAVASGMLSFRVYFDKLKKLNLYPDDHTIENELEELRNNPLPSAAAGFVTNFASKVGEYNQLSQGTRLDQQDGKKEEMKEDE